MANLRTSKGLLWKGYSLAGDMAPHIESMSHFCHLLAERLGLDRDFCSLILLASPLHDVGKIAIPDRILLKPGPARLPRSARSSRRTRRSATACSRAPAARCSSWRRASPGPTTSTSTAAATREAWPDRDIPVEGRIAAVADVFDALTSDRVYRPAFTVAHAIAEMRLLRGTQFDPAVLDVFLDSLDEMLEVKALYETRIQATASQAVGVAAAA